MWKGKPKGSQQGPAKAKGKGTQGRTHTPEGKGTGKPVDDPGTLQEGTQDWHQVDAVPHDHVDNGTRKRVIMDHIQFHGLDGTDFFEHVLNHLGDMGRYKNRRIYIGPGQPRGRRRRTRSRVRRRNHPRHLQCRRVWNDVRACVREGETNGVASSSNCLDAFDTGWARPFGWPKFV